MLDRTLLFVSQSPESEDTASAYLEEIRQEHEGFLSELESLAVHALASGDWSQVINFINFEAQMMAQNNNDRQVAQLESEVNTLARLDAELVKELGDSGNVRKTLESKQAELNQIRGKS
jgi:hypothetical protein